MTPPTSTKINIDVTLSTGEKFLKKAFRISGKTLVVIREELIDRFGINDDTWFKEEAADDGIFLRICSWSDDLVDISSKRKRVSKFEQKSQFQTPVSNGRRLD